MQRNVALELNHVVIALRTPKFDIEFAESSQIDSQAVCDELLLFVATRCRPSFNKVRSKKWLRRGHSLSSFASAIAIYDQTMEVLRDQRFKIVCCRQDSAQLCAIDRPDGDRVDDGAAQLLFSFAGPDGSQAAQYPRHHG
ncbi:MAG: hypothetical protein WBW08_14570 [Methyloceanibacter sp.]